MLVGAGAGAGSGVPHASLPHGSRLLENMLLVILEVDEVVVALGGGAEAADRLKAELMDGGEEGEVGLGAEGAVKDGVAKAFDEKSDVALVGGDTGDAQSNKSFEAAGAEGCGREVTGEAGVAFFVKLKSRPLDETEGLRAAVCCAGGLLVTGEKLSNRLPPPPVGDVTCGAAGDDLAFEKPDSPEKGDGFSCDF